VVGITVWVYLTVGRSVGKVKATILLVLRLIALALIIALLLRPSIEKTEKLEDSQNLTLVAIDTSASMEQPDADKATRIDAARELISQSGLLDAALNEGDDENNGTEVRLYAFDDGARALPLDELHTVVPQGATTFIHSSLEAIIDTVSPNEKPRGLILFTDGHDLEMVAPSKTARLARTRDLPIFAVPMGGFGNVRDVSVRMANYQPYAFVNQAARVSVLLRVVGCEHKTLQVQLRKGEQIIDTKMVEVGEEAELPVEFKVTETEVDQHEYEVRVLPVVGEAEIANNSSVTYLNVINQRIRVLLLEGSPYWDTTFLQRALFANQKIDLDSFLRFAPDRVRRLRKSPELGRLELPKTADEFRAYTAIVLGRDIQNVLGTDLIPALEEYAKGGGIVVFARGEAYPAGIADDLQPVDWADGAAADVQISVARDGGSLSAFKHLRTFPGGVEALPKLIAARRTEDPKTLASTLANAEDSGVEMPGFVYRRYGRGQVLSVGVDGLWKWGLNPQVADSDRFFDRFWDQLMLWLLARSDLSPESDLTFRGDTTNLPIGEKLNFRLNARKAELLPKRAPVSVQFNDQKLADLMLSADPDSGGRALVGTFVPAKPGRYEANLTLPSGDIQTVKFMVYEERLETTEVATDIGYLKALCEGSGGRILEPEELESIVRGFGAAGDEAIEMPGRTELEPIWDTPRWFYLIGLFLGLDWFLRRRWGLS